MSLAVIGCLTHILWTAGLSSVSHHISWLLLWCSTQSIATANKRLGWERSSKQTQKKTLESECARCRNLTRWQVCWSYKQYSCTITLDLLDSPGPLPGLSTGTAPCSLAPLNKSSTSSFGLFFLGGPTICCPLRSDPPAKNLQERSDVTSVLLTVWLYSPRTLHFIQ